MKSVIKPEAQLLAAEALLSHLPFPGQVQALGRPERACQPGEQSQQNERLIFSL